MLLSRRNNSHSNSRRRLHIESLESRRMLACDADFCGADWSVEVANDGPPTSPTIEVQLPNGAVQGNSIKIRFWENETDNYLYSVLLTEGAYLQSAAGVETAAAFRGFQYYSSDSLPVVQAEPVSIGVREDVGGTLTIVTVLRHDDPVTGDAFESTTEYNLASPVAGQSVAMVSQTVTNLSGRAVEPAWDGHRAFEEQWRLFGVSSMFVAVQFDGELPDWYDDLDPNHNYVGAINDGDPSNDGWSPSRGWVYAHEAAVVATQDNEIVLNHDDLAHIEIPTYEWYDLSVLYQDPSSWLETQHAFDSRLDQRIDVVSANGLASAPQLTWSGIYDRYDLQMVDGKNLQFTVGIDGAVDAWPANATQSAVYRVTSGKPTYPWHQADLPADVSGDGQITIRDLRQLVSFLMTEIGVLDVVAPPVERPRVDVNADGFVTVSDLRLVFSAVQSGSPEGEPNSLRADDLDAATTEWPEWAEMWWLEDDDKEEDEDEQHECERCASSIMITRPGRDRVIW